MIAEILGPSGRIHYRRPPDHPLCDEARQAPGYTVRLVETETVESPCEDDKQGAEGMKRFTFKLKGFRDRGVAFAETRAKARYKLWLRYADPYPCSFREFMAKVT